MYPLDRAAGLTRRTGWPGVCEGPRTGAAAAVLGARGAARPAALYAAAWRSSHTHTPHNCANLRALCAAIQDVVELLQRVGTVQLFLVQRPGPTSFVVREEGSEVKRKVQIGSRITCTW